MSEKKRKPSLVDGTSISPASFSAPQDEPEGGRRAVSVRADSMVAKKDFEIHHNGYDLKIKVGDDLSGVPSEYHPNLRTEGVL